MAPTWIVSSIVVPTATFTRPSDTTAYTSGDLVANNVTAGSVTPMSWSTARVNPGSFGIHRCRIAASSVTTTNFSFRLHLYAASPTCANGDNGAWSTTLSGYVGSMDVTSAVAFSDGAKGFGIPNSGTEIGAYLTLAKTLYGLLEARAAYVPVSAQTFTVELEVLQN